MSDGATQGPGAPNVLGGARAGLVAWVGIAVVDAIVMLATLRGGVRVRLVHHLYDAGQALALGLGTYAVVRAWHRWGSRRRGVGALVLALFAVALAHVVLRDDMANVLQRTAARAPKWLVYLGAALGVGLAISGAWLAARLGGRPRWRFIGLSLGLAVAIGNHFVVPSDYPGLHLLAALTAALVGAASLVSLRFALALPYPRIALALAGVLALASLVITPSRRVWRELFRSPGTVLAPFIASVLPTPGVTPFVMGGSDWYRDRTNAASRPPSAPPLIGEQAIVMFITVDAFRADAADAQATALPALDALRHQSVEFALARSPTSSTVTTLTSVFTGKYYSSLYWSEVASGPFKGAIMPHEDPSPTLAGLLSAGGVHTVHALSLHGLMKELGVGRGFDEELETPSDYGAAATLMSLVLERLQRDPEGRQFYFMHFVDPHAPYDLAGPQGTDYERYVRELQLVDKEIGRLTAFLRETGLERRTTILLSADHGEAFGEHNTRHHAVSVYEEMVRVPLWIRLPGVPRRVVQEPVSVMDVAPTVLDLFGLPTPGSFMAESLVPFLRGKDPKLTRPIAVDAGRRIQALYFPDGIKVIVDLKRHTEELYDLHADPAESDSCIDTDPRSAYYLRAHRTFFDAHKLSRPGYVAPWRKF